MWPRLEFWVRLLIVGSVLHFLCWPCWPSPSFALVAWSQDFCSCMPEQLLHLVVLFWSHAIMRFDHCSQWLSAGPFNIKLHQHPITPRLSTTACHGSWQPAIEEEVLVRSFMSTKAPPHASHHHPLHSSTRGKNLWRVSLLNTESQPCWRGMCIEPARGLFGQRSVLS